MKLKRAQRLLGKPRGPRPCTHARGTAGRAVEHGRCGRQRARQGHRWVHSHPRPAPARCPRPGHNTEHSPRPLAVPPAAGVLPPLSAREAQERDDEALARRLQVRHAPRARHCLSCARYRPSRGAFAAQAEEKALRPAAGCAASPRRTLAPDGSCQRPCAVCDTLLHARPRPLSASSKSNVPVSAFASGSGGNSPPGGSVTARG